MEAGVASGSMILFSFSEKCRSESDIFLKKDVPFHPASGE
jgi:hypothetical protein